MHGPDPLLEHLAGRLERPAFAPYLGRRARIPDEPLVLGGLHADPVAELLTGVPLSLSAPPKPGQETVAVDFVWEQPPAHVPAALAHRELADVPVDFSPAGRQYRTRRIWRTTEMLRARLYAARPTLHALSAYLQQEATP